MPTGSSVSSASLGAVPGWATTNAITCSPNSSWGMPITAASTTSGCSTNAFSISAG
ncbi:MAG: hypothetical protein QM733_07150 [Ilumatobacteraceae bacterium]